MKSQVISEGAMIRLFNMAIKANEKLENATDEKEYGKMKKRSDEWNEIVMALGLKNELRQYYAEKHGEQE